MPERQSAAEPGVPEQTECLTMERKANVGAKAAEAQPGEHRPSEASAAGVICPGCGNASGDRAKRFRFRSARGESCWQQCERCRAYYLADSYDCRAEEQHTTQMPWGRQEDGLELNDFKRDMFSAVLETIRRHSPDARSVLDVGCSFGGFLLQAREAGFDAFGVDIVADAVQYVQQQGFTAEQCGTLADCRLFTPDHPADAITVLDAHIYWPDQPNELRAAWQRLRPGGLLVMRAITKAHFVSAGRILSPVVPSVGRQLIRRAVTDHRFCMPLDGLLRTIADCGFTVREVNHRAAQHSRNSSAAVRSLFTVGHLSWKLLRTNLAPGVLIVAQR